MPTKMGLYAASIASYTCAMPTSEEDIWYFQHSGYLRLPQTLSDDLVERLNAATDREIADLREPIVWEEGGLAMSSRNVYLSASDRTRALTLNRALSSLQADVHAGTTDVAELQRLAAERLDCDRLDYIEIIDATDLTPLTVVDRPARVAAAAIYGSTRLIDNMSLLPGS